VRRYAAVAATQCSGATVPEFQILPNKIAIAAIDNNNPISQVSIIFKYEKIIYNYIQN
jgi:hypothetical protein